MRQFGGKAFFIDRDNINTDEIIPAKYLTYIEKAPLKVHLLEDLKVEGIEPSKMNWMDYGCIIAKANFGSGSSREMAVWAFEVNGINLIIASNFARIFRENAFNGGMLAIELGDENIEKLFSKFDQNQNVSVSVDLDKLEVTFDDGAIKEIITFELNSFEKDLIAAGGWVALANKKY